MTLGAFSLKPLGSFRQERSKAGSEAQPLLPCEAAIGSQRLRYCLELAAGYSMMIGA
jgi:hypothetical protein